MTIGQEILTKWGSQRSKGDVESITQLSKTKKRPNGYNRHTVSKLINFGVGPDDLIEIAIKYYKSKEKKRSKIIKQAS